MRYFKYMIVAALLCAACAGAKPLKATKITVGNSTVRAPRACDGSFEVDEEATIQREAPPAAGRSYNVFVDVTAKTSNFDNVTGVKDATNNVDSATMTLTHINGQLTDTCKDGTFLITFISESGVDPTPKSRTVTVPALGYSFPSIKGGNGNPLPFQSSVQLKNCGAAAVAFTLKAKELDNVQAGFVIAPAPPINIGAGATQAITINGSKISQDKSGKYTLDVTAPGAIPACHQVINVE